MHDTNTFSFNNIHYLCNSISSTTCRKSFMFMFMQHVCILKRRMLNQWNWNFIYMLWLLLLFLVINERKSRSEFNNFRLMNGFYIINMWMEFFSTFCVKKSTLSWYSFWFKNSTSNFCAQQLFPIKKFHSETSEVKDYARPEKISKNSKLFFSSIPLHELD